VEQAQHSTYVVHGHVRGAPWVELEPKIKRPYTYWKLEVVEQPVGKELGGTITMRSPGGEVGDLGYHVAGAASFSAEEEVFVTLRDTDEGDTREIVGLASGKYRVERDSGGKTKIVSGLGLPVTGEDGHLLSAEEFSGLLLRASRGQETDADKNVFINKQPIHDLEAGHGHGSTPAPTENKQTNSIAPRKTAAETPKATQESPREAEESSTGSSAGLWILLGVVFLGFLGLVIFLRR
jgi:hypothetical protein